MTATFGGALFTRNDASELVLSTQIALENIKLIIHWNFISLNQIWSLVVRSSPYEDFHYDSMLQRCHIV